MDKIFKLNFQTIVTLVFMAFFSISTSAETKVSGILQDCKSIPETIIVDIESIKEVCFTKKVTKISWAYGLDNFVAIENEDAGKIPKNYLAAGVLGVIRFNAIAYKHNFTTNIYITFDDNTRIERLLKIESKALRDNEALMGKFFDSTSSSSKKP